MKTFACPHCRQPAFSYWDKYLAAKWKIVRCSKCDKRVSSAPFLLAFFCLFYLMDVIDIVYLSVLPDDMIWLAAAVVDWLILDLLCLYLPLVALRDRGTQNVAKKVTTFVEGTG